VGRELEEEAVCVVGCYCGRGASYCPCFPGLCATLLRGPRSADDFEEHRYVGIVAGVGGADQRAVVLANRYRESVQPTQRGLVLYIFQIKIGSFHRPDVTRSHLVVVIVDDRVGLVDIGGRIKHIVVQFVDAENDVRFVVAFRDRDAFEFDAVDVVVGRDATGIKMERELKGIGIDVGVAVSVVDEETVAGAQVGDWPRGVYL